MIEISSTISKKSHSLHRLSPLHRGHLDSATPKTNPATPSSLSGIEPNSLHSIDRLSSSSLERPSMKRAPSQSGIDKHDVIKTLLNRRLNDIAKYIHGNNIIDLSGDNPISNPKNAKLILSILSHDKRYIAVNKLTQSSLDLTHSSHANHGLESESFNDVCNTIKRVIRTEVTDLNFEDSDDIYSKSELNKMLRRPLLQIGKFKLQINALGLSLPALSKVQTELSSLTDRPLTKITRAGTFNEHTMQQLPVSIFEKGGVAETTFGISHSSKTALREQVNNALLVQYEGRTAIRSARTETENAVKQLALLNIQQEHLINANGAQMSADDHSDKPLKFAIFSAMDGITAKFESGIPGLEYSGGEKKKFLNIQRSIDKVWGDTESKPFTLTINGTQVTRQVAKPMLFNLVLSNTSKNSKAIIRARQHNAAQCGKLVESLAEKYLSRNEQPSTAVYASEGLEGTEASLREGNEYIQATLAVLKGLAEDTKNLSLKYAVEALDVMQSSTKLTKKEDPLKECLLMHFLMKEMGINENFQCKSGQDRTPAMLAMTKAIEFIEDIYTETEVPKLSSVNGQLSARTPKQVNDNVFDHMSGLIEEILDYTPSRTNAEVESSSSGASMSGYGDSANMSAFKALFSTILRDCAYEPTIHVRTKPVLKNNSRALGFIETPHHSTNAFVDWPTLTGEVSRVRAGTQLSEPNSNQSDFLNHSTHSNNSDINGFNLGTQLIPLTLT